MQNNWTEGYVADVPYIYGYYPELNPLRLRLILLQVGLKPPVIENACELGFGQGLSINLHATASQTVWQGTDFNPAQVSFAYQLAEASGAKVVLHDQSFADFCTRSDLPEFDFIGLHGIWSWISEENRRIIIDFVNRRLKVGGVLYISYNTLPGWAGFAPMQHLMSCWRQRQAFQGQSLARQIEEAIAFSERLLALEPAYLGAYPTVKPRLEKLKTQDRHYLAHEYFNANWHLDYFHDMAEALGGVRLNYIGSAHYLDHVDALNLSPAQQQMLQEIADPLFRETVRDFLVNQQFRRDYWIKGGARLSVLEQAEALRAERVVLMSPRQDIELKATGMLGEAKLNEEVYRPLLDALADYQPRTLARLEQTLRAKGVNFSQILQAVMVLIGTGHLAPAQGDTASSKVRKACERLNSYLLQRARGGAEVAYLASPVTGGGVPVSRFQQLFLLAYKQGIKPQEWAVFAWKILAAQGQRLVKDGQVLETEKQNLEELQSQAEHFAAKRLTILKALQIVS